MKIARITLIFVLLILVGGFVLLAASDVPVQQTEVRKEIPNERFFQN